MLSEEDVEVGAVDVDFAADLREGDDSLVAIVLPGLWRDSEDFTGIFGFYPFAAGVVGVAAGDQVDDLLQRIMEISPLFFRDDKKKCRGAGVLEYALHSSIKVRILSLKGWNRVNNSVV